nr:MAG: RNA-dependent RNA polymerase [Culex leishbunyavirus 1]
MATKVNEYKVDLKYEISGKGAKLDLFFEGEFYEFSNAKDYIKYCHEEFCKRVFGDSDKRLPTMLRLENSMVLNLSGPMPLATPDYVDITRIDSNKIEINIIEVKTKVRDDDNSMILEIEQKYGPWRDMYSKSGYADCNLSYIVMSLDHLYMLGPKQISKAVAQEAYDVWRSLRLALLKLNVEETLITTNFNYPITTITCNASTGKNIYDALTYSNQDFSNYKEINFAAFIRSKFSSARDKTLEEVEVDISDLKESNELIYHSPTKYTELPMSTCEKSTNLEWIEEIKVKLYRVEIPSTVGQDISFVLKSSKEIPQKLFLSKSISGLSSYKEDIKRGWNSKKFMQIGDDFSNEIKDYNNQKRRRHIKSQLIDIREIEKYLFQREDMSHDIQSIRFSSECSINSMSIADNVLGNTRLYNSLLFLHSVLKELNINRSTYCSDNSFKVCYISNYKSLLFVRSIGSRKSVFYHLLVIGKPLMKLNDKWTEIGDGIYMTKYVRNMTYERLEQLLYFFPRLLSSIHSDRERYPDIWKTYATISTLIGIDGKNRTIDLEQMFRYLFLKSHADFDTMKTTIAKYNEVNRTPMMAHMMESARRYLEAVSNKDYVRSPGKYLSWISLKEINLDQAIRESNFYYIVASIGPNDLKAHTKVYKKIIDQELKLQDMSREQLQGSTPPELCSKDHEYSRDMMFHLGKVAKAAFMMSRTGSFESAIETVVSEIDRKCNLTEYSTLKKSSVKTDNLQVKRVTCARAVNDLVDLGVISTKESLLSQVPKFVNYLDSTRGNVVSVFAKDQQTGVREIFVMNILLRIIVSIMEKVCESYAKSMPTEYITKPDLKNVQDNIHYSKLLREKEQFDFIINFSSSSDNSTWAQMFVMPAFMHFVNGMFHDSQDEKVVYLKRVFMDGLELITTKEIFVDESTLSKMESITTLNLDPHALELSRISRGCGSLMYDVKARSIRNYSNMMQGVTHILSSLVHASYLFECCRVSEEILRPLVPNVSKVIMTCQATSDDSTTLLSMVIPKKSQITETELLRDSEHLRVYSHLFLMATELGKSSFCAKCNLAKSAISCLESPKELNGVYVYKTKQYVPVIKFAVSYLSIQYEPSLLQRVYNAISSISQLYGSGLYTVEISYIASLLQWMLRSLLMNDDELENIERFYSKMSPYIGFLPVLPEQVLGVANGDIYVELYKKLLIHQGHREKVIEMEIDKRMNYRMSLRSTVKEESTLNSLGVNRYDLDEKAQLMGIERYLILGFDNFDDKLKEKSLKQIISGSSKVFRGGTLAMATMSSYSTGAVCVTSKKYYEQLLDDDANKSTIHQRLSQKTSFLEVLERKADGSSDVVDDSTTHTSYFDEQVDYYFKFALQKFYFKAKTRDTPVPRILCKCRDTSRTSPFFLDPLVLVKYWSGKPLKPTEIDSVNQLLSISSKIKMSLDQTLSEFSGSVVALRNYLLTLNESKKTISLYLDKVTSKPILQVQLLNLLMNYSKDYSLSSSVVESKETKSEFMGHEEEFKSKLEDLSKFVGTLVNCPFPEIRSRLISQKSKIQVPKGVEYLSYYREENSTWMVNYLLLCSQGLVQNPVPVKLVSLLRNLKLYFINKGNVLPSRSRVFKDVSIDMIYTTHIQGRIKENRDIISICKNASERGVSEIASLVAMLSHYKSKGLRTKEELMESMINVMSKVMGYGGRIDRMVDIYPVKYVSNVNGSFYYKFENDNFKGSERMFSNPSGASENSKLQVLIDPSEFQLCIYPGVIVVTDSNMTMIEKRTYNLNRSSIDEIIAECNKDLNSKERQSFSRVFNDLCSGNCSPAWLYLKPDSKYSKELLSFMNTPGDTTSFESDTQSLLETGSDELHITPMDFESDMNIDDLLSMLSEVEFAGYYGEDDEGPSKLQKRAYSAATTNTITYGNLITSASTCQCTEMDLEYLAKSGVKSLMGAYKYGLALTNIMITSAVKRDCISDNDIVKIYSESSDMIFPVCFYDGYLPTNMIITDHRRSIKRKESDITLRPSSSLKMLIEDIERFNEGQHSDSVPLQQVPEDQGLGDCTDSKTEEPLKPLVAYESNPPVKATISSYERRSQYSGPLPLPARLEPMETHIIEEHNSIYGKLRMQALPAISRSEDRSIGYLNVTTKTRRYQQRPNFTIEENVMDYPLISRPETKYQSVFSNLMGFSKEGKEKEEEDF